MLHFQIFERSEALQYVLLGQHTPDLCPTSNAKTRQRVAQMLEQLESAQKKYQVKVISRHVLAVMVILADAPSAEAVRDFAMETGLVQWNSVEFHPSWNLEDAVRVANTLTPINW